MQLGRYNVSTLRPTPITSIRPNTSGSQFAVSLEGGYEVYQSYPLGLLRRRSLPGNLALAVLIPHTPLLVLQGGGNNPVYPPNKAVVFHDKLGVAIAEMEFGERIRGVVVRRGTICIALCRRIVAFSYGTGTIKGKERAGFHLVKIGEWETAENENGLMAISTSAGSTLLALPGRQPGHVQLVSLSPCPPVKTDPTRVTAYRNPIILAHTHSLSSLTCTADGAHVITTSERGTLLRVWDTSRGHLVRELRRGVDRAEMWGATFQPTTESAAGQGIVGWSDKGTIHIWSNSPTDEKVKQPSISNLLSKNLPLPKYFSSTASFAQYRLPRKNPHAFSAVVGAAAGRAGVHSKTEGDEEEESERFIVIWVPVTIPEKASEKAKDKGVSEGTRVMGTREERRSFGSDATSRTATPTLKRNETPTPRRQSSYNINPRSMRRPILVSPGHSTAGKSTVEWQLIAITYSGDWYRLRLPKDDDLDKKGKCELVEYRRLGVGGSGW